MGVLLDYCLILWYNFGIFDEVRGIFMTEDKKKNYEELKEVAYNLADEAVPVDKTYSEIVEESALEFIYEQYDEKQREEILASIERGRDGSISWKGENGDYIKLKFENGELVRGVLKDRDENGVYQKIKFKVKEDGYVYKGRNKDGSEIEKEKVKVKESDDKDKAFSVSVRTSEKDGLSKFVKKAKVVLNDRDEVVKAKKSSSSLMVDVPLGVVYEKESKEYKVDEKTGDILEKETKDEVLFSPLAGVMGQKDVKKIRTDEEGNSQGYRVNVGGNVGLFGVGAGVEAEVSQTDKDGNSKTRGAGVSGGIGYLGVNGEVSAKREDVKVDELGQTSQSGSAFEVGGSFGLRGAGAHYEVQRKVKDENGNERETKEEFSVRANIRGSGFLHKTSLNEKDESGQRNIESEKGGQISVLISENRVVDKQKGEIDGKKFENGVDFGIKDERVKRVERLVRGRADFKDKVELLSDGVGLASKELKKAIEDGKRFDERVNERSSAKEIRGTVFDNEVKKEEKTEPIKEEVKKEDEVKDEALSLPVNGLENGQKVEVSKMDEKEKSELKDDIKEQKALQQKGIEVLEGDGKIEDKLQQIERHFEPKRNEMEFLENINKFDTRVMTKEIIRAEEEKKNKAYNQAVIRRMQDFGR